MKRRGVVAFCLIVAVSTQGCAASKRYFAKPYGQRTWIPAAVCAVVGGVVGAAVAPVISGGTSTSTARLNGGQTVSTSASDDQPFTGNNAGLGGGVGAATGALLCGLIGHGFEEDREPPMPPPTPAPEGVPPPSNRRLVLRGINFDFNENSIRPDSRPILDEAADVLALHPRVRISVEGHTDYIGSDEYNEKLSVRRAEAVFRYLSNRGVAPSRMDVVGYGKSRPVTSNDTEEGRAQNRRVELHVVNPSDAEGVVDAVPAAPAAEAPPPAPAP